jgi:hypothetical protein
VRAHPALAEHLDSEHRDALQRLAQASDVKITLQAASADAPRESFELHVR